MKNLLKWRLKSGMNNLNKNSMDLISFKKHKAKKQHICDWCEQPIAIGELYEREFLKFNGNVYTWKAHIKCREITSTLNMFDGPCDEGLTAESFQEYIRDEYTILTQEFREDSEFTYPKFSEQLDFVINHYEKKGKAL